MKPTIAQQVDSTFILIVGISVLLLLIVTVIMIYFVIKYNRKRHPKAADIHGNTTLEILWTLIPTVLVLVMFFSGYSGFKYMRNVPEDAMPVTVTGQMWKWTFQYENGKQTDTLFVPNNKPVKMNIKSVDVNHSFYIPALRVKEDAIPGRTNYLWFLPTEIGRFDIACAEYCGLSHAYMYSKLVVMPEDEFYQWYSLKVTTDTSATKTDTLKTKVDTLKK